MSVQRFRPKEELVQPDLFYTAKDLARRWRIHPITVWKWSAAGKIPKPAKLGPNTSRWRGRDILEHEAALSAKH